jgi:hypothetical protein
VKKARSGCASSTVAVTWCRPRMEWFTHAS